MALACDPGNVLILRDLALI